MAIAEDPGAPNRFIFACTANGVAAKCARVWGFRPWRSDEVRLRSERRGRGRVGERTFKLRDSTTPASSPRARPTARIARASPRRHAGRSVRHPPARLAERDREPVRRPTTTRAGCSRRSCSSPSIRWPSLKASALQRTRYRELSPVGQCADLAFVDRLEQDHFEDGRWASPLTNTPRIQVLSPTYCGHSEDTRGGRWRGTAAPAPRRSARRAALLRRGADAGWMRVRGAGRRDCQDGGVLAARESARGTRPPRKYLPDPVRARGRGRARRRRSGRAVGDAGGLGVRPRVAGRGGDGGVTAARRARPGSTLLGVAPTRRWPRRCRSRSARPATARAPLRPTRIFLHAAGDQRRPFSSTRSTPPRPTARRRRRRCSGTGSCMSRAALMVST